MVYKALSVGCLLLILCSMTACMQVCSFDGAPSAPTSSSHQPHAFLQTYLHFSQDDLRNMEAGSVVAKIFDTSAVENEVGAFGVVRLNIPKEFFVEQFRDIVSFTKNPEIKEIGKFSARPSLADIQDLTLDSGDVDALKKCEPGSCKVKIDTAMMERFQQDVDWSASDASEQAAGLMHQMLVDYVTAYMAVGDEAMGEYHDKDQPLRIADAFHGMLQNDPSFFEYVPELYTYLRDYPHGYLPNVENFFYWSKEQFALKPVINLFHVTIYSRKRNGAEDVFITSKQIYASHYFETSLGFTAFVEEVGGEGEPNSYLMYLNRSRFDQLKGKLKGLIVTLAKGRVHNGVKKYFQQVKERLESAVVKKVSSRQSVEMGR